MKYSRAYFLEFVGRLREIFHMEETCEFFLRLGLVFQDLFEQYRFLYGERVNWQEHLFRLCCLLGEAYQGRDEFLKGIDREREKNPLWFFDRNMVGYVIYVDRWAKDVKSILKHRDYLHEMGVTFLHLMPCFDVPEGENDGGYAVRDYYTLRDGLGTCDDLKEVAEILKKEGIFLMVDVVVNHTSSDHLWAKKAKEGESFYEDFYYFFPDRVVPDEFEKTMPEIFPETSPGNFTYVPEVKKWVMTVFHRYQWDLNYTNPYVLYEMVKIILHLANGGADILRLDAIPYLWKRLGTSCQNEPEVHRLIQIFKACVSVVAPGVLFVAEAIVQPKEILKYFGEGESVGKECDLTYNASGMVCLWEALATRQVRLLTRTTCSQPHLPSMVSWLNYLRCHDDIGLGFDDEDVMAVGYSPREHRRFLVDFYLGNFPGSWARGLPFMSNPKNGDVRISGTLASLAGLEKALESEKSEEVEMAVGRILLLFKVLFSFRGVPLVYYGDEIGNLNDYRFREREEEASDSRWVHRPWMDWEKAKKRKNKKTIEGRIFQDVVLLIHKRSELPVLWPVASQNILDSGNESVFAYLRSTETQALLVLANFSDKTQLVSERLLGRIGMEFPLRDVISGREVVVVDGYIVLVPYACLWLVEAC
ncbi:MAG: alpha-amylase family glycosyl hydrolase [Brevinematales bacterium]|nr:alpha-amylase family glycosyl hydrolase [Brevinematales bacterium]